MPCISGPSEREELNDANREIEKLEGMLCDACTALMEYQSGLPDSCRAWYAKHEAAESEKLKRVALAKLTPRERRLLGLK